MTDYTQTVYAVLAVVFIYCFVRYFLSSQIKYFIRKKKSDLFFEEHFSEDRIYTIDEIAFCFKLDREKMLSILKTLDDSGMFLFLKKRGVAMNKDYYSKYEMKILTRLLAKKNKLSF